MLQFSLARKMEMMLDFEYKMGKKLVYEMRTLLEFGYEMGIK